MGKFRIKISPKWHDSDFVIFRYSTNGIFWRTIMTCKKDIYSDWFIMSPETAHYGAAGFIIDKFNSVADIKKYEKTEKDVCKKLNHNVKERIRYRKAERNKVYKKYN